MVETSGASAVPGPHTCPCGCGRDVPYTLFCCRPAWDRLPASLRREISSTRLSFARRGQAMAEAREWFAAHPRGGRRG